MKKTNPFGYQLSDDIIASHNLTVAQVARDDNRRGARYFGTGMIVLPRPEDFIAYLYSDEARSEHSAERLDSIWKHPAINKYLSFIEANDIPDDLLKTFNVISPSETVDFFNDDFGNTIFYHEEAIDDLIIKNKETGNRNQLVIIQRELWDYNEPNRTIDMMRPLTMLDISAWWNAHASSRTTRSITIGEITMLCDPLAVIPLTDYSVAIKYDDDLKELLDTYRPQFPRNETLIWTTLAIWVFTPEGTAHKTANIDPTNTQLVQLLNLAAEISHKIHPEEVLAYYRAGLQSFQHALDLMDVGKNRKTAIPYVEAGFHDIATIQRFLDKSIDAEIARNMNSI